MDKKGFIDMVKGLLALVGLVLEVFKSFSFFFSNYLVKHGIYSLPQNNGKIRQ